MNTAAATDPTTEARAITGDIVVGVDTSDTARRAALRAAELAAAAGAGVHLVMSTDGILLRSSAGAGTFSPVDVVPASTVEPAHEARERIDRLAEELAPLRVTSTVDHGGPADLISTEVAERHAALAVVGNRRVQGASRFLGSVGTSVVRNVPGDVLVVQSTADRPADGPVVVGVDRSDTARRAAVRAAEWAAVLGVRLHVVMGVERGATHDLTVGGDRFHVDWISEAQQFVRGLARTLPHDDVTTAIEVAKPAAALCTAADEVGASTIVVGNRRVRGAGRVLGSVAVDVLRQAPCDVLITDSAGS